MVKKLESIARGNDSKRRFKLDSGDITMGVIGTAILGTLGYFFITGYIRDTEYKQYGFDRHIGNEHVRFYSQTSVLSPFTWKNIDPGDMKYWGQFFVIAKGYKSILEVVKPNGETITYKDRDEHDLRLEEVSTTRNGHTKKETRDSTNRQVFNKHQQDFDEYLSKIVEIKLRENPFFMDSL